MISWTRRIVWRGPTEGDWRSAVSRAYYAVFHFFREFLLANGVDVGQGGACHSNLYVGLNNCGIGVVSPVAAKIDLLRTARVQADYDLRRRVHQQKALDAAHDSAALIADFQRSSDRAGRPNRRRREALPEIHRPHPLIPEPSSWPNPSPSRPA